MPTREQIKENAKQILTGKWGKGALMTLCYVVSIFALMLLSGFLSFIPFIGIALFVVEIPILLGFMFSFVKLRRGENVGPFDFITIGFENFKRSWCLFGSILLKMIAPIIVSIVIMVVGTIGGVTAIFTGASLLSSLDNTNSSIKATSDYDYEGSIETISYKNPYARSYDYDYDYDFDYNPYSSSYLPSTIDTDTAIKSVGLAIGTLVIFGIVMIAMIIVSIWSFCKSLLYALSYYIAYDNPNMTAKEAVQTSENLMRGNRGKLFVLQFSFIGWAILANLTLGIGYLWLIPYMMVSLICFYESLVGKNNVNNNMNNMGYANNTNGMNNMNYQNNNMNNMNYNNTNMMNGANNMNQMNDMSILNNQYNNNMTPNANQAPQVQEYVPVNFDSNQNQYNQQAPAQEVNQYNQTTPVQNVNQYNSVTPEPNVNQYNPVTPEPNVNQYNPVTPEPNVNQYNPVTPEPNINQYNQQAPTNNENQFNPMNNDFNNPNNNM